jgi:transcriptional regulator with XRE-family HTH domain
MKMGEVLKIFRLINDIKENEAAKRIAGTISFVSSIESGRVNPICETIKRFAKAYNVDPAQILFVQKESEKNNCDYRKTMQSALIEWFKNNPSKIEISENGEYINRIQMGKVLKAFRIVRQKNFSDVKLKTSMRVSKIEKAEVILTFDVLLLLAEIYKIPASKILEVQEKSVKQKLNFQEILYEVLLVYKSLGSI